MKNIADQKTKKVLNHIDCYEKAIEWVKNNTIPEKGIVTSSAKRYPYLEVTGYLIPTLLETGENELAKKYADFLSYMQHPNGSFCGDDGKEYFFDTAQVLRGLNAVSRMWPEYKTNVLKAGQYLSNCIDPDGALEKSYNDDIPESVKIYALYPLLEAGEMLGKDEYSGKARKAFASLKSEVDSSCQKALTHFLSYVIDGFIEFGEKELANKLIKDVFSRQREDGSISAYPNVDWVCSTGLAQIAIIGYKLGFVEEADRAMNYLASIQNESGGFFGSYEKGANYFPDEEIGWAAKFYIDAFHKKVESFFDTHSHIFPDKIEKNDVRLKKISDFLGDLSGKKVLDAGCGKGRFAVQLKKDFPSAEISGLDVSEKLLDSLPEEIQKFQGTILSLPFEDNRFDFVYCVEALEHTVRIEKAISELCRVVKSGGKVAIIDKNIDRLGELEITDFEKWFDATEIKKILSKYCSDAKVEYFQLNDQTDPKLFLLWTGIKKSAVLDEDEWHEAMVSSSEEAEMVTRIKNNQFPVWIKPLLESTEEKDSILELGSGTGELSAILAAYGRNSVLLDYSSKSLDYSKKVFSALGLEGKFLSADIFKKFPLEDESVDWVWSSGTLEHFTDDEIFEIMRESSRVCRKGVMSLVPNANSVIYRAGKFRLENSGTWKYGTEIPKFSMKPYFEKNGLKNVREFSIGAYHSLEFMEQGKEEIKKFYDSLTIDEINQLNQGYLLFTYGEK